jgi:hypothetical protein
MSTSTLNATLERINRLRKQSISSPDFIEKAKEQAEIIKREQAAQFLNDKSKTKHAKREKQKLSSLYSNLTEHAPIY